MRAPTTDFEMCPRRSQPLLRLLLLVIATLVACEASAAPSAAQKETARNLMQLGDRHFAAENHEQALEAYRNADAIMKVPTTAVAVGRAEAALGNLVEAVDAFGRARRHPERSGEPAAFAEARSEAMRLDAEIAERIPVVDVRVVGPQRGEPVELVIDGTPVRMLSLETPQRVNPGEHRLEARAKGFLPASTTIQIAEGERKAVEIALRAAPAEPDAAPPETTIPGEAATHPVMPTPSDGAPREAEGGSLEPVIWTAFAVGAAGLVVGAVTGGLSWSKTQDIRDRCGGATCPADEGLRDEHREALVLANVANASFAVAAVGGGVALITLLVDINGDDEAPDQKTAVTLGPGSIGLHGTF